MPYAMIVGQHGLKRALELAFVVPRLEGVLLSGQRGTGKSTVVRAFSIMAYGRLPVTLPINATEDRVVGGWDLDELFKGAKVRQPGLLEAANNGLLYIDEVNLLDDHIVNVILDVSSTGMLIVEREGQDVVEQVRFCMVGTMNPSEGGLRPQLLDRFALMADVITESDERVRVGILDSVLDFEAARNQERNGRLGRELDRVTAARAADAELHLRLQRARAQLDSVLVPPAMAQACVQAGKRFQVEGHRGDYVMALAARAHAALRNSDRVTGFDLVNVAQLALQHRRPNAPQTSGTLWTEEDAAELEALVAAASSKDTNTTNHGTSSGQPPQPRLDLARD
jgi:magnesium chelatase subunit I